MSAFVNNDHTSNQVNRRSRTGFLVYYQLVLSYLLSKQQNSCNISSFGSELVAMKRATEYNCGLRYKMRKMGIAITGPCFI